MTLLPHLVLVVAITAACLFIVAFIDRVAARSRDRILRELPRWIPVEESLPDRDCDSAPTVWGFDGEDVFLCEFHGEFGFQSYGASCDREGLNSERLFNITHWTPVDEPPPPKET